ncbi:hypothetical protein HDR63_02110 [bacterium]|nr:hypothetical protein [bacterium]
MPNPNVGLGASSAVDNSNCPTMTAREYCTQNPSGKFESVGGRHTYNCPDGYNINSTHTTCTRAAGAYSTNGTDGSGSYTITYPGSCDPEHIAQECVNLSCGATCISCADWLSWGEP